MLLLYVLLVAYIVSINFYAFLLVKTLREKEKEREVEEQAEPLTQVSQNRPPERNLGKLCVTGLLGGAITIYASMFIFKYKRSDMLLMILMPLFGVLNIYFFILLFKSGFGFLLIR